MTRLEHCAMHHPIEQVFPGEATSSQTGKAHALRSARSACHLQEWEMSAGPCLGAANPFMSLVKGREGQGRTAYRARLTGRLLRERFGRQQSWRNALVYLVAYCTHAFNGVLLEKESSARVRRFRPNWQSGCADPVSAHSACCSKTETVTRIAEAFRDSHRHLPGVRP
jgi:hypothetical protein